MKDFLKKLLDGQTDFPSKLCLDAFAINFKDAINVEWHKKDDYFEVIFYHDEHEHIAHFNKIGNLVDYLVNLSVEHLPFIIRSKVEEMGEIMNVVMRNKGNSVEYEVIYRNTALSRHSITLTNLGKILIEKQL
jgi:hypothetical protein